MGDDPAARAHLTPERGGPGARTAELRERGRSSGGSAFPEEAAPALADIQKVVGRSVRHADEGVQADPTDLETLLLREAQPLVNYWEIPLVTPLPPAAHGRRVEGGGAGEGLRPVRAKAPLREACGG
ncbi:hypothetical protein [Streptomyces sp. NPDC101178]|uniref:hypothetical protein n=1 Tax=Streptomyces sp. NPDC101178 TaxID=3366124 RepID=UPI00380C8CCB